MTVIVASKSSTHVYMENGQKFRTIATAELEHLTGNKYPHFSITSDTVRIARNGRRVEWGGGADHDLIRQRFPDLAPYIRWHLCNYGGPMHYYADGLYWLGYSGWCDGKPNSPPNLGHFATTIVAGAVPNDDEFMAAITENQRRRIERQPADIPLILTEREIAEYLYWRLPALMDAFWSDMHTLFGPDLERPVIELPNLAHLNLV